MRYSLHQTSPALHFFCDLTGNGQALACSSAKSISIISDTTGIFEVGLALGVPG